MTYSWGEGCKVSLIGRKLMGVSLNTSSLCTSCWIRGWLFWSTTSFLLAVLPSPPPPSNCGPKPPKPLANITPAVHLCENCRAYRNHRSLPLSCMCTVWDVWNVSFSLAFKMIVTVLSFLLLFFLLSSSSSLLLALVRYGSVHACNEIESCNIA